MSFQPGLHLFPYADRRSDSVQYCSPLEGRTSTMKIALMMHKYRKMSSTSYSEVPGDLHQSIRGIPNRCPPGKRISRRESKGLRSKVGALSFFIPAATSAAWRCSLRTGSAYPHPESRAVLLSAIGESLVFLDTDRGPNLAASPFPDTPRAAGSTEPTS